ncbi:MAG: DUF917 domain-containing protein [Ignavibacteriales bacterium]
MSLNKDLMEAAVAGGSFYGGGGGGAPSTGREMGNLALSLGDPQMVSIEDVPGTAILVTTSAVGAPAATGSHAKAYHYIKAVELLARYSGAAIYGFITNECGGLASVNGWVQAAALGLPVVDAACNGRAHPTGTMGSMGLHQAPGYVSLQVGVGGSVERGTYLEIFARGGIERASNMMRQAAVQAGGLVAVARNPVEAAYVRTHGAAGAIGRCIEVGRAMLKAAGKSPTAAIEATVEAAGGSIVCAGKVLRKDIETTGGFDIGRVEIEGGFELVFWNEYMTLEGSGERLATFPDLMVTMDASTGLPLSSAEVEVGRKVTVVVVPKRALILGAGVRDRSLYHAIEQVTGKHVVKYAFDEG